MDSNNIGQAVNAVATMRTLPWLTTPSDHRHPQILTSRIGATAPMRVRDLTTSMPVEGAYRLVGDMFGGVCAGCTTDRGVIAWGKDADHKFSTRLGPSASPPV